MDFGNSDERYQEEILPHVSRTFALTIPQLPPGLRTAVTNAYLLCRIADTIEDEPAVSPEETFQFLERFAAVVSGAKDPAALACALDGRFSDRTLPAERDLVSNLERIVRVTWGLGAQRADRKSTRLNSSHGYISYAVFCLKKKRKHHTRSL